MTITAHSFFIGRGVVHIESFSPCAPQRVLELVLFIGAARFLRNVGVKMGVPLCKRWALAVNGDTDYVTLTQDGSWEERIARYLGSLCNSLTHALIGLIFLHSEVLRWLQSPTAWWWAASQPPLSISAEAYFLLRWGYALESFLVTVRGGGYDKGVSVSLLIHHVATLAASFLSWWAGFVRVGIVVALLHNLTDLPIQAYALSKMVRHKAVQQVSYDVVCA